MVPVICFLLGALIGWIGSVLMRTPTSPAILGDIWIGAVGGVGLPFLLDTSSALEALLASSLGAGGLIGLTYLWRKMFTPNPG